MAAVRAATNRIACRLRLLLLEPGVRQVSSGALDQLNLDVIQCEQFAAGEPVPGLREGELLQHFASLRYLLHHKLNNRLVLFAFIKNFLPDDLHQVIGPLYLTFISKYYIFRNKK